MSASLAAMSPPRSAVGRHGSAVARFERSGGRTILREGFSRVPLQIIRPLYPEGREPAHLTLLNPTGGHVGGDRLETALTLGEGARVLCTTQGATKVYRSLGEPVVSTTEIRLERGAELEFLPDPVIPFGGAMYRQEVRVELRGGARLLYGESLYPGRVASGESFDYASVALRFAATLDGRPLLSDALEVRPGGGSPRRLGLFEPYPYLGTFYVLGGEDEELGPAAERADRLLARGEGLAGGAARLEGPGVLVRWLAETPVRHRWAFDAVWNIARVALLGKNAVRLRKF